MSTFILDLVVGGAIVAGALWGLRSGGIRIAGPFVLAAGFIIMKENYPEVIATFREQPKLPTMVIVKLAIFAGFMAYGLLARFLHRAVHATGLGIFNRLTGFILGSVTGAILAGFILWMMRSFAAETVDVVIAQSRVAGAVLQVFALLTLIAEQLFQA